MIKYLMEAQKGKLEFIANQQSHTMINYLFDNKDIMEKIFESREVSDYAEKNKDVPLISLFAKYKKIFPILSFVNKEGLEELKVLNGKMSDEIRDISKTKIFQDSLRKPNEVIIAPVDESSELKIPVVKFALSKHRYFGDEFIGEIIGSVPLSEITKNISRIKVGNTGFISLIDREGNILSYPQKDKILTKIIGNGKIAEELISNATALNAGFARASILDLDGFTAYSPIKEMGWSVMVTLPYKEFMIPPNSLRNISVLIFFIVFVTGGIISFLFAGKITKPLLKLVDATVLIAKGDFSQNIEISSKDEIGELARSFIKMTKDLRVSIQKEKEMAVAAASADVEKKKAQELNAANQQLKANEQALKSAFAAKEILLKEKEIQDWIKTGQTKLSNQMRGNKNINNLSMDILSFLAQYLDFQIGTFYVEGDDESFNLKGTYAFAIKKGVTSIKSGEGIIGQAVKDKKNILISQVPADCFKVESSLISAVPNHVIAIPFILQDIVKGVMEFGSFKPFSDMQIDFLNLVSENIAIAINSAQERQRVNLLLEETQAQAEELQSQQEELRVINEELKEKNIYLENQKSQITRNNLELENIRENLNKKAKELEVVSSYKSEFLANISHELRTPLNSLLILSNNLSQNKQGNLTDDQVESAMIIHNGGKELLSLINDILDLSKIEAGKMSVNFSSVSLKELADSIVVRFKNMIAQKGLTLNVNLSNDIFPIIQTDRQRLDQIIKNLISNAIKFTDKGSVTVDIFQTKSDVNLSSGGLKVLESSAISVTDTGIGIPEDKQLQIFEAFCQGDSSTSKKYGGTGLGLSISRKLAKLLEGEIQLKSIHGKGSTFTLYLPFKIMDVNEKTIKPILKNPDNKSIPDDKDNLKKDDKPIPEEKEKIVICPNDYDVIFKDKKILLVDDDMRNVYALSKLMKEKGMKVFKAGNGKFALEMIEKEKDFNLIIMDMMMPEMDGYEACKKIREQGKYKKLPIIALTAKAMKDDREKCMKAGASEYLSKPVDLDRLYSMMRIWLY